MSVVFKALINSLNAQFKALNDAGLKIYDDVNPDFYIEGIYYDSNTDKLIFKCREEEEVKIACGQLY